MLIKSFYHHFRQQLTGIYPASEAAVITDLCFAKIAGLQKLAFISNPALEASAATAGALEDALTQLLSHRPVQYVLGEAVFGHLSLAVNEQVLIPRPETEELAEWMVDELQGQSNLTIMDIGTGSGCIPIYLHSKMQQHHYYALDICDGALNLARQNAAYYHADINFLHGNILAAEKLVGLPNMDVLVSNPPYIPQSDAASMEEHVTKFEPHLALFVPNNNPLLFYEAIVHFAQQKLRSNGNLYLETHWQYAAEVGQLCQQYFEEVIVKEDMFGKPRMVKASRFR